MNLIIIWASVIIGLCIAFKYRYNILFGLLWLAAVLADYKAACKVDDEPEKIALDEHENFWS